MKQSPPLRWRLALLAVLPFLLVAGVWKVRQLQRPIEINLQLGAKKPSQEFFVRLWKENQRHPYASSIHVQRWTPDGITGRGEDLIYSRKNQTLEYGVSVGSGGYGWTFGNVKNSDLHFLAHAGVGKDALYFRAPIASQLFKRGCRCIVSSLP